MTQRSFRAIGPLCFLLALAVGALGQTTYQRPTPPADGGPPTGADLEVYDGASHSLVVQVLNLTPYDIVFDHNPGVTSSITAVDEGQMQNRNPAEKSFMFAPVGIPDFIPAAAAQDFVPEFLYITTTNPDGSTTTQKMPNPAYNPDWVDTTTHPYPMVLSWDDQGGFKEDNWVYWTVKKVPYIICADQSNVNSCVSNIQDVQLGLWLYRNKPTFNLRENQYFQFIVDAVQATAKTIKLVIEPENPAAWANAFLAYSELTQEGADFAKENAQQNDGNSMWVASYVIPHKDSACVTKEQNCVPSTMAPTSGDAVHSEWAPSFAGPCDTSGKCPSGAAEANLVVSVHVLRGHKAKQCDPSFYPKVCPLGSESVVMITVSRIEDFTVGVVAGTLGASRIQAETGSPADKSRLFLLQAGAGRIRELLNHAGDRGIPELELLRSVMYGLNPAQRQVLRDLVMSMGSGTLPTEEQRRVVRLIADELQALLKQAGKK